MVLTRRVGEAIVVKIGEVECRVKVVSYDRGRVGLCFDAPLDFKIVRAEILRKEEPKP